MTQDERRKEIVHLFQENVSLETNRLAEKFGVSMVTIRRDFEHFEKLGIVTPIYGGAIVNRTLPDIELEKDDSRSRLREKRLIAKAAADLIRPGDTVLLDAGSSVKELAIELLAKRDLTILTNSILVINVLAQSDNNVCFTLPGYFKKKTMCFLGAMTLSYLESVHVNFAFIGISGLTCADGGMIPDAEEAHIKRKMSQAARCTVVLADHLKLGESSMFTALPTSDIDILITGKSQSEEIPKIRESGVQVIEV